MGMNTIGIRAESIVDKKEKIIFGFVKQISMQTEGKRESKKVTDSRKLESTETETEKAEQHKENGEQTEIKGEKEKEESEQREKENEQKPSEMIASQEQSE
jgi:hypothetical protein